MSLPILTFAGVRLIFGDSPVSVNYGYAGVPPPDYIARLVDPGQYPDLLSRVCLAFGFLWVGLIGICITPRRRLQALLFIVLVIAATLLLSSRITRVIGILYVVLIPGVLALVERTTETPPRGD